MLVQENYVPRRINQNASLNLQAFTRLGGFLCESAGTLELTINSVLVVTMPVTAGVFHPMPFSLGGTGTSQITLSGGAAGAAALV